jgi:hypothetical protein
MTEYRIKQGGVVVAQSNSLTEIWHYAYQYAKDGTVHVQVKDGKRWKDIFTARADAIEELRADVAEAKGANP